jgi:hypothetical protein
VRAHPRRSSRYQCRSVRFPAVRPRVRGFDHGGGVCGGDHFAWGWAGSMCRMRRRAMCTIRPATASRRSRSRFGSLAAPPGLWRRSVGPRDALLRGQGPELLSAVQVTSLLELVGHPLVSLGLQLPHHRPHRQRVRKLPSPALRIGHHGHDAMVPRFCASGYPPTPPCLGRQGNHVVAGKVPGRAVEFRRPQRCTGVRSTSAERRVSSHSAAKRYPNSACAVSSRANSSPTAPG